MGAADLRYPELDSVVGEDWEGEAELMAVEGALGFADGNRVETAIGMTQCV